jgi:hemerythrin-like domain-containing protein
MSQEELLEALKELNTQHYTFRKRFEELQSALDRDPVSASRDFLMFFENVIIPHFKIEEEKVFPTVLHIKPEAEHLITQLKEEHKTHFSLLNQIKEAIKELCRVGASHTEKEEPLYQTVLEEVLKTVGKK